MGEVITDSDWAVVPERIVGKAGDVFGFKQFEAVDCKERIRESPKLGC